MSILNQEKNATNEKKHLLQDTAMDILSTIVKYSPVPLSPILVNTAFPATIKCILSTDDHEILQSGGECLRTFINGMNFSLDSAIKSILLNSFFLHRLHF